MIIQYWILCIMRLIAVNDRTVTVKLILFFILFFFAIYIYIYMQNTINLTVNIYIYIPWKSEKLIWLLGNLTEVTMLRTTWISPTCRTKTVSYQSCCILLKDSGIKELKLYKRSLCQTNCILHHDSVCVRLCLCLFYSLVIFCHLSVKQESDKIWMRYVCHLLFSLGRFLCCVLNGSWIGMIRRYCGDWGGIWVVMP